MALVCLCLQVAFYVESYSLQRQKVYAQHTPDNRRILPAICAKRKKKKTGSKTSVLYDDWYDPRERTPLTAAVAT